MVAAVEKLPEDWVRLGSVRRFVGLLGKIGEAALDLSAAESCFVGAALPVAQTAAGVVVVVVAVVETAVVEIVVVVVAEIVVVLVVSTVAEFQNSTADGVGTRPTLAECCCCCWMPCRCQCCCPANIRLQPKAAQVGGVVCYPLQCWSRLVQTDSDTTCLKRSFADVCHRIMEKGMVRQARMPPKKIVLTSPRRHCNAAHEQERFIRLVGDGRGCGQESLSSLDPNDTLSS